MNSFLFKKRIVIAVHYLIDSAPQAMRDYIRSNSDATLLYLSHPLPGVNPDKKEVTYGELSIGEKVTKRYKAPVRFQSLLLSLLLEFVLTIYWVFNQKKSFDVFIGIDNFNALQGLILKKMGKVKKVVYYTIDYFPTRYENKLLNDMYHAIDKFCVKHADETWNVSAEMVAARERHNKMKRKEYNRQFTMPIGVWYDKVHRLPFSKINKKKLFFVGHLVPHMGADLIITALPEIIRKIPDIHVDIVGGGEELERLKALAKGKNVSSSITFWGWVRDRKKLETIMKDAAVGLATFNTDILDAKVKNADPMKIKDYMLMGMPVIATNALKNHKVIEEKKCGLIIPFQSHQLSNAVTSLLTNQKKLALYRNNALSYVQQFDYEVLFRDNLGRILQK